MTGMPQGRQAHAGGRRESGLLLDIVNRNGRDAWAAVPITQTSSALTGRKIMWIKTRFAQASLSKVLLSFHDGNNNAMRCHHDPRPQG
jgi:hypothetical protein